MNDWYEGMSNKESVKASHELVKDLPMIILFSLEMEGEGQRAGTCNSCLRGYNVIQN